MVLRLKVNVTMRSSPAEADTPLLYVLGTTWSLMGPNSAAGSHNAVLALYWSTAEQRGPVLRRLERLARAR